MRVLLSAYGSRGDVEPLVGLAVRLRALGAEARVCAPPDFAQRLAGVGVPLVPFGQSARALTTGAPPPSSLPRHAAELIASQFDAVTAAAAGCDTLVATGMMPAAALRTTLTPETRARATAVAGTIRTDGATVAATLLLDAVSQGKAASVRVNHAGSSSQGKCPAPGTPGKPTNTAATCEGAWQEVDNKKSACRP